MKRIERTVKRDKALRVFSKGRLRRVLASKFKTMDEFADALCAGGMLAPPVRLKSGFTCKRAQRACARWTFHRPLTTSGSDVARLAEAPGVPVRDLQCPEPYDGFDGLTVLECVDIECAANRIRDREMRDAAFDAAMAARDSGMRLLPWEHELRGFGDGA